MRYSFLALLILALSFALNFKPIAELPSVVFAKKAASYSLYPFEKSYSLIIGGSKNTLLFFVKAYSSQSKISELDLALKQAKAEISSFSGLKEENQRLNQALRFSGTSLSGHRLVPSNVIGREDRNFSTVAIIDAGTDRQVGPGMTVVSSYGLVGQIIESSKYSSKVMLITSPQSSISVFLPHVNAFGVAKGGFGNKLDLEYIGENLSVEVSTPVVVSSVSHAYIPGILVGHVSRVVKNIDNIFQKIEITPASNLSRLGIVFVCK